MEYYLLARKIQAEKLAKEKREEGYSARITKEKRVAKKHGFRQLYKVTIKKRGKK